MDGTLALDSQVKKHFDLAGVRAPVQLIRCCLLRARPRLNRYRRGTNALTLAIDKTAALLVVHKGQAIKRLCFCPWAISFLTTFTRPRPSGHDTTAVSFHHEIPGCKPHHLLREAFALFNHLFDKVTSPPSHHNSCCWPPKFSARLCSAPGYGVYAHYLPVPQRGIVEWRVTQGRVVLLVFMDMPLKIAPLSFCRRRRMARLSPD